MGIPISGGGNSAGILKVPARASEAPEGIDTAGEVSKGVTPGG